MTHKFVSTLKREVVPLVAINAAGFVEPTLDNFINKNAVLGKVIGSNASMNPNAKYAKYAKVALYNLVGLGIAVLTEGKGGKMKPLVEAAPLFCYGLAGATAAEDPVFNVPSPGYAIAGNPQSRFGGPSAIPVRQVKSRTGNFIS